MDRVQNDKVRIMAGVTMALVGWAEQYNLRWFGHVERMEKGRVVRKVWESDVRGERKRG